MRYFLWSTIVVVSSMLTLDVGYAPFTIAANKRFQTNSLILEEILKNK
jgi:hypothetical protein